MGSVADLVRQSPPIDMSVPYNEAEIRDKTIVITGGASGFGAAFVQKWATCGATVIVGDISVDKGDQLVRSLRKETSNPNLFFVHCDVTQWQSQVELFRAAIKLSAKGWIDCVVANAGIAGVDRLEMPSDAIASSSNPPPPDLRVIAVNLTGVLYTAHLALFHMRQKPNSGSPQSDDTRDRHLLLLGSVASLGPLPGQPQYTVTKHGVLGLFRTLRASAFAHGVRINILCPYFIDTPIIPVSARALLAGGAMGKIEDVVDAGTRFVADARIAGRALAVGPKMGVVEREDGEWEFVPKGKDKGEVERAVWEVYAHDFEEAELFSLRFLRLLNAFTQARGWIGWAKDMVSAIAYGTMGR